MLKFFKNIKYNFARGLGLQPILDTPLQKVCLVLC